MRVGNFLRQYRKKINPPYKASNLLVLGLTFFILLVIPLTVISSQKARPLGIKAAATLVVTPDPVPAYTHPTVTGVGFESSAELLVGIPGDLKFTRVTADSIGAFSFLYTARDLAPGYTYSMEVWGQRQGNKWVLIVSTTFEVVEMEKPGDINGDGVVNIFDASILASRWGTNDPDADLNGNGVVDIFDASILASNWEG